MSFTDSYKRLEKLCSEIYGDNHGLSIYIDEMISKPNGAYYVSGWNEDLKQLKHYRWVRNKISHEPGCTEENMCKSSDTQWLENFRLRIMSSNGSTCAISQSEKSTDYAKTKANLFIRTNELYIPTI